MLEKRYKTKGNLSECLLNMCKRYFMLGEYKHCFSLLIKNAYFLVVSVFKNKMTSASQNKRI
jgi:hypothetical protein